jgi:hypothetical protein
MKASAISPMVILLDVLKIEMNNDLKKYFLVVVYLCLSIKISSAQKVTSITAEQVGQSIQVSYELASESPCFVSIFYSVDDGLNWQGPLKNVAGDVGDKIVSGDKKIMWDVLSEISQFKFNDVKFKIIAEKNKKDLSLGYDNEALAKISFETREFYFGLIKQGDIIDVEFEFTNSGSSDLIITNATGSCGCMVPQYPKEAIKKGAKGVIKVTFNSAGKMGMQDKTVTITSNALNSSIILHLKGVVEARN